MNKKMNAKNYLMGFTGGLIMIGLVSSAAAYAQNTNEEYGHLKKWQNKSQVIEFKAEKLGMSAEELKIALENGKSFMEIAKDKGIEVNSFGKRMNVEKRKFVEKKFDKENAKEIMAEKLGMSAEELKIALENGKSFMEIAKDKGIEVKSLGKQRLKGMRDKDNDKTKS